MYGLLLEAIADYTRKHHGNDAWNKVVHKVKLSNVSFSAHQQYSETLFVKLCKTVGEVINEDGNVVMENVGIEFITFISQYGYDRMMRVLGRHFRDFLNGIDNLHEYMRFSYGKMKPPSFIVEKETNTGLEFHYRTKRKGFLHYLIGQIKEVGRVFYKLDCKIKVTSETFEVDTYHIVLQIDFKNNQYDLAMSSVNMSNRSRSSGANSISCDLPIRSEIFFELFPFHLIFKKSLEIISVGSGLRLAMKNIDGELVKDLFNINRPMVTFSYENILNHQNNIFELVSIEPVRRQSSPIVEIQDHFMFNTQSSLTSEHEECCLKLKGQMMFVKEWEAIIFMAIPVLENLETMFNCGFYINDLSMHDSSRDLVLVGNQQSSELKMALDQERQRTQALEDSMKKLDMEIRKTDQLLYQMIPKNIADRLRSGEPVMNICEVYPSCTILFSDVVGFTTTCSQLAPMQVVAMLNEMYTKFDKCTEKHSVYKVETIGDAYMVVSGLPEKTNNHGFEIIEMAFDMLNAISTLLNPVTSEPMKIRVGCHSGAVVAGVVGLKMPRYCLFGDAVNTASRMESTSQPMRIHISQSTKSLLERSNKYRIVERGSIEVKGKGEMKTYFVLCKLDDRGNSIDQEFMDIYDKFDKMEIAKAIEAGTFDATQLLANRNEAEQLADQRNLGLGFKSLKGNSDMSMSRSVASSVDKKAFSNSDVDNKNEEKNESFQSLGQAEQAQNNLYDAKSTKTAGKESNETAFRPIHPKNIDQADQSDEKGHENKDIHSNIQPIIYTSVKKTRFNNPVEANKEASSANNSALCQLL